MLRLRTALGQTAQTATEQLKRSKRARPRGCRNRGITTIAAWAAAPRDGTVRVMISARRPRIILSFGMALASSWAALPGAARAIDADLSSLPGRDAAQPLSTRLQTHDQTELLMLLDELAPGADADPNSRAVAELLRAGQPDVVADHALDALGRLKSREARSVLTTFTRHRRPGARARAYSALASVASPKMPDSV